MEAAVIASSAASKAINSHRLAEEGSVTGRKSTAPAIVVRSPASGKRLIRRMPDWPAVSRAQLSSNPWPSEVSTPMPVTTTTGRPWLSKSRAILTLPAMPP